MSARHRILSFTSILSSLALGGGGVAKAEESGSRSSVNPTHEVFWSNAELGFEDVHMRTFVNDNVTVGILPQDATGAMVGFGAGVRIVFVTLGLRARVAMFPGSLAASQVENWQLWTVGAELGFRVPLGRWEPFLAINGGYATIGGLSNALDEVGRGLDVHGVDARMGAGFDYYLSKNFTVGALLGGDLLFLSRSGVPVRDLAAPKEVDTLNQARDRALEANGSTIGGAWSLVASAGVHF